MTQHSYGWKPSPPDFRDHVYMVPDHVRAALPPSVDLSRPALPGPFEPAWDQGSIGSCGPHTASADIVFAALKQQSLPAAPMPSRLFVYWCARSVMGTLPEDSGVTNRDMLKALARHGWCDELLWPYVPNRMRDRPPQMCFDQAEKRKITQYLAVPQTLDAMRGCLAAGDPFIFGFSVYESLETAAVAKSGVVPMPKSGERVLGGHDVLVVGYDDAAQRFKFRNSWGAGWGQSGYGTIPYAYATNPRLAGDFWTVRHAGLPAPVGPTPPVPPPGPSPVPVPPAITHQVDVRIDGVVVKVVQVMADGTIKVA